MADTLSILTGNFVNIESQVTELVPKLGAVCVILAVGFVIIGVWLGEGNGFLLRDSGGALLT